MTPGERLEVVSVANTHLKRVRLWPFGEDQQHLDTMLVELADFLAAGQYDLENAVIEPSVDSSR